MDSRTPKTTSKSQPGDPVVEVTSSCRGQGDSPSGIATTVERSTESAGISDRSAPLRLADFDEEDHARGLRLRQVAALTAVQVVFVLGRELSAGYAKLEANKKPVRGRGSLFGKWVQNYLPTFDRKSLDRWRLAYDRFVPLVSAENGTACLDFFNRIELSAIYALCHTQVTDEDRKVAIEMARSGKSVNKKKINAIVDKPSKPRSEFQRKTIDLPAGKITIAINHPDFRQALKEALSFVEEGA